MNNIIRSDKKGKGGFTCISNEILQSKALKPAEVGILVYLLSLPADFVIHKSTIWRQIKIGRDQFNKVWKQLTKLGYIQTIKYRDNSSGSQFTYRHVIHENPVPVENLAGNKKDEISRTLETSDWETVHIKSNNTNDPASVSNHRNGVEVRHGQNGPNQNMLGQNILGPNSMNDDRSIVPHPQLRFGSVRDNEVDQQTGLSTDGYIPAEKPVPNIAKPWEQEATISRGSPVILEEEFVLTEADFIKWMIVTDDLFKDKFPNWEKMLKNKPLHTFLQETRSVHTGMPEIIDMMSILKKYLK